MAAIGSGNDPVFGIHATALALQAKRMEVLSANIANADTPGYEARDIDFAQALARAAKPGAVASRLTPIALQAGGGSPGHIPITAKGSSVDDGSSAALAYRIAVQPTADRNAVDVQVEQAKYADAALHYQASLSFADGRVRGLLTAITGQ